MGSLLAGVASLPAHAQTAAASVELPAVSVQGAQETGTGPVPGYVAKKSEAGSKTDTPLIETPQSISVISAQQIQDQHAANLNEVLRYTAGVQTETRGAVATRYDLMNVRGFTPDFYLDGMKVLSDGEYATPQIDPYLLERVDVLKGPASVLYGQSDAGGMIDQISKLPTATPFHEVGVEFGSGAHYQGTFDFSGPLDKQGQWLYRLTGIGRSEDGQVTHTQSQRLAIAPSLTWRPDADTSLTLQAMYQHDPKAASYGSVPPQGTVLANPLGGIARNFYDGDTNFEKFDRTEYALGYQFSKRLNDNVTIRSRARWMHTDLDYASVYANGLESDYRTLDRGTAASTEHTDQGSTDNSVEVHVNTGPVAHTILAGFDYQHLSGSWNAGFGTAPSLDIYNPVYNLPIEQPARTLTKTHLNQYGIYLQDQMKFDRWVLTLSTRHDWASTYQSNADYGTRNDQWDSAQTYRAGITYVFPNGIAPYFSYAESFTPTIGTSADGSAFKPERGRQYEVGVKYQPPGTRSLYTAALFDLTRQNLTTPDLTNPSLSVQSGEARSQGVELEAKMALTDRLDVLASYTYLDTTYTKDNSGLQGKRLAAIPMHQAAAWVHYAMPAGPLEGLSLGGGARYTGSTFNSDNTFVVKSFLLGDLSADYDMGAKLPKLAGLNLYMAVHNIADTKYVASCYYGDWCAYGYGRQIIGGMRYRF